jgi:hypothetical protein
VHLRWSRCRLKVNRPTQRFSFWVLFTVVTMSHYLNMTSRPYTTSHCLNITWQHYMTTSSFSITISQHDITLSQHDITISHDITWHHIVSTSHCHDITLSRPHDNMTHHMTTLHCHNILMFLTQAFRSTFYVFGLLRIYFFESTVFSVFPYHWSNSNWTFPILLRSLKPLVR